MPLTTWTNENSIIQGDLVVNLEISKIYKSHVELCLYAYSQKWTNINIALEYRINDEWKSDTRIISAIANSMNGNKIYGLKASKHGYRNILVWKYPDNHILQGDILEMRVRVLPSLKQFSQYQDRCIITEPYGINNVDLIANTNSYKIIGINNDGNYICSDESDIHIVTQIDSTPLYTFSGVDSPLHAIQKANNNYIIADTGNNRIIEIDEELTSVINTFSFTNPQFIDLSESTDTLLITGRSPDIVQEVIWNDDLTGEILWSSSISLNNPSSATYSKINIDKIIISDTVNNQIVIYDKINDQYSYKEACTLKSDYVEEDKTIKLYRPFRCYQLYDGQFLIIEESGQPINFDIMESSSSSSSD